MNDKQIIYCLTLDLTGNREIDDLITAKNILECLKDRFPTNKITVTDSTLKYYAGEQIL